MKLVFRVEIWHSVDDGGLKFAPDTGDFQSEFLLFLRHWVLYTTLDLNASQTCVFKFIHQFKLSNNSDMLRGFIGNVWTTNDQSLKYMRWTYFSKIMSERFFFIIHIYILPRAIQCPATAAATSPSVYTDGENHNSSFLQVSAPIHATIRHTQ